MKLTLIMRDGIIWNVEVSDDVKYKEILDGKIEFLPVIKDGVHQLVNKAMILAIQEKDGHYVTWRNGIERGGNLV